MPDSARQHRFLASIAEKIPRLFAAIASGNTRAEFVLGTRLLQGRRVRLLLVAEVIEPGGSPLATHGQIIPVPDDAGDSQSTDDDQLTSLVCTYQPTDSRSINLSATRW